MFKEKKKGFRVIFKLTLDITEKLLGFPKRHIVKCKGALSSKGRRGEYKTITLNLH